MLCRLCLYGRISDGLIAGRTVCESRLKRKNRRRLYIFPLSLCPHCSSRKMELTAWINVELWIADFIGDRTWKRWMSQVQRITMLSLQEMILIIIRCTTGSRRWCDRQVRTRMKMMIRFGMMNTSEVLVAGACRSSRCGIVRWRRSML